MSNKNRSFFSPSIISGRFWTFMITDCPTEETLIHYRNELKQRNVHHLVRVCEPTYSTNLFTEADINVFDWFFPDGANPPSWVIENWFDLLESLRPDVFVIPKKSKNDHRTVEFTGKSSSTLKSAFYSASTDVRESNSRSSSTSPSPSNSVTSPSPSSSSSSTPQNIPAIAIHCVAGLGRAPLLVCMALIQYGPAPPRSSSSSSSSDEGGEQVGVEETMEPSEAIQYVRKQRRNALNVEQARYIQSFERVKRKKGKKGDGDCVIL